jgi:hypothetical protein
MTTDKLTGDYVPSVELRWHYPQGINGPKILQQGFFPKHGGYMVWQDIPIHVNDHQHKESLDWDCEHGFPHKQCGSCYKQTEPPMVQRLGGEQRVPYIDRTKTQVDGKAE